MAPLTRQINLTNKFILQELPEALRIDDGVLLQDAGRGTTALVQFTLLGKIAASGKWIPYDATAVDGSAAVPGILLSADVTGAALVAGDVTGQSILKFGARCDVGKLVLENGTLATIVGATLEQRQVEDMLADKSLFMVTTEQVMDTY